MDVLVVGESLVDVVQQDGRPDRELPGGSAANAAVALARLGVPVGLVTAYGEDERGDRLARHLAAEGVATPVEPRVLERTSTAEARIGPDGAADYRFDVSWRLHPSVEALADEASPAAGPSESSAPGRSGPRAVLVSSLAPVLEPGASQVLAAVGRLARRAPLVYDVNVRPAITGQGPHLLAAVQVTAGLADLVKASDEDLDTLLPGLATADAARRLLGDDASGGAGAVVVTRGGDGAVWVDRDRVVEVPGEPVVVADTIGAGDTFGAALLQWLLRADALGRRPGPPGARWALDDDLVRRGLAWAGRAAAVTVSRPGADPPTLAELSSVG